MDPALLKEREAFKRRAMAQPVVENKKSKSAKDASAGSKSAKKAAELGAQSQVVQRRLMTKISQSFSKMFTFFHL
jgi:hypothetical protein